MSPNPSTSIVPHHGLLPRCGDLISEDLYQHGPISGFHDHMQDSTLPRTSYRVIMTWCSAKASLAVIEEYENIGPSCHLRGLLADPQLMWHCRVELSNSGTNYSKYSLRITNLVTTSHVENHRFDLYLLVLIRWMSELSTLQGIYQALPTGRYSPGNFRSVYAGRQLLGRGITGSLHGLKLSFWHRWMRIVIVL